jgi:hypothetical protein
MAQAAGLFVTIDVDHFPSGTPAAEWLTLRTQGDPGLAR